MRGERKYTTENNQENHEIVVSTLQKIKIGLYDLHWVVRIGCFEKFIFQLRSSSAGRDGIEVVEDNLPGSRDPRPSAVVFKVWS